MNRYQDRLDPYVCQLLRPLTGVLAVCVALIAAPHLIRMPVPDESIFLYEGVRVAQGDLPYRDFFDFILPGIFYLTAGLVKLFGVSLVALRLAALSMTLGSIALALYLGRWFLPWRWWVVYGLFLIALHIPAGLEVQHHTASAFFGMLAVACLWKAVFSGSAIRSGRLTISGLAIGLSTLFTQSLGVLLGLWLGIFLWVYAWRHQKLSPAKALLFAASRLALPALLPVLAVFAWFAGQGALDDLWRDAFLWLLRGGYEETTTHWYFLDGAAKLLSWHRTFFRNGYLTAFSAVMVLSGLLPVLGLLWPAEYFGRHWGRHGQPLRQQKDWKLLFLWLSGIGFMLAAFSYPNTRMIAWHAWTLYLLGFMALRILLKRCPGWVRRGVLAGLAILPVLLLGFEGQRSMALWEGPRIASYGTVEKSLATAMSPRHAEIYNQLVTYVREAVPPGDPIFVYNQSPELYLIANRPNPTRFQLILPLYNTPGQLAEMETVLRRAQPAFVFYDHVDELNFHYDLRFKAVRDFDYRLRAVEALIRARYRPVAQVGNLDVFQRKDTFPLVYR